MPFAARFDEVYARGIRDACRAVGWECWRADELLFDGLVIERIHKEIAEADIVIAEVTDASPNVLYEVGYAHALR